MTGSFRSARARFFPPTLEGAADLQRAWSTRVDETPLAAEPRYVAGADLSYHKRSGRLAAALVLMEYGRPEPLEVVVYEDALELPYVPGFLSFREGPALLGALDKLQRLPDLILCDGHGRAHPRRFGLACHVGVATGLPTIGVGKSILVGSHRPLAQARGARARLTHEGEVVGTALRTRAGVRPVFVSIGHRVDLSSARRLVLAWATRFRLPEPQRLADLEVSRWQRAQE